MDENEEDFQLKYLKRLVEKLTTSGSSTLDEKQMKSLKKICKSSEKYVEKLYFLLIKQLKRNHAEIRLSAFQICSEIFLRSHCFRKLITDNFDTVYNLTILFSKSKSKEPLKPLGTAKKLKTFAISTLHSWNKSFGEGYIYLRHGYEYLRDVENVDFINNEIATEEDRRRRREEERKQEHIKNLKVQNVLNEMEESSSEITNIRTEFNNTFKLLIPDLDNFFVNVDNELGENDTEAQEETHLTSEYEYGSDFMRKHGLTKETLVQVNLSNIHEVQEISDNEILITLLKEQVNAVENVIMPKIKRWEQSIMKYSSSQRELMLKIIDQKKIFESILARFASVKFVSSCKKETQKTSVKTKSELECSSDDDDDFIDVPFDDPRVVQAAESEAALFESYFSSLNKSKRPEISEEDLQAAGSSGVVNSKPGITKRKESENRNIDSFINKEIDGPIKFHPSITGLSTIWSASEVLHDHEEDVLKPSEMLGIATRAIDFKEEWQPVRWECRAPLQSGRLCPRKDRKRCPFHGPIIPRDFQGVPVKPDDAKKDLARKEEYERAHPPWQDPTLLAEIKAATGVDLDIKKNKKRKKRYPNLTNIKEPNTPQARLKKKIFSKKSVRRINKALSKLPQ
ncbi:UV-stimulated scaffold protein A [Armadillidium vulgare]|nr:UV-stimulated scaffold protein A [Armadillidium vulgare]